MVAAAGEHPAHRAGTPAKWLGPPGKPYKLWHAATHGRDTRLEQPCPIVYTSQSDQLRQMPKTGWQLLVHLFFGKVGLLRELSPGPLAP